MKTKIAALLMIFLIPSSICFAQWSKISDLTTARSSGQSLGNAEYLLEGIALRQDLEAFFADPDAVKKFLCRWITSLPHSYIQLPCFIHERPESVLSFSLPQLIRVYLILDALKNGTLVSQIGTIIENYQEGDYFEPGGLGLIRSGQIYLELRPSEPTEPIPKTEGAFIISQKDLQIPHIFLFHLHPLGKSGPAPGPSIDIEMTDGQEAKIGSDVGTAIARANHYGEYHHLLISKLGNKTFNIDYYAAEAVPESGDSFTLCHKLEKFKIVDLGNWRY
ncbi:MAG: hypothetical protein V1845_00555 [bacterium]